MVMGSAAGASSDMVAAMYGVRSLDNEQCAFAATSRLSVVKVRYDSVESYCF